MLSHELLAPTPAGILPTWQHCLTLQPRAGRRLTRPPEPFRYPSYVSLGPLANQRLSASAWRGSSRHCWVDLCPAGATRATHTLTVYAPPVEGRRTSSTRIPPAIAWWRHPGHADRCPYATSTPDCAGGISEWRHHTPCCSAAALPLGLPAPPARRSVPCLRLGCWRVLTVTRWAVRCSLRHGRCCCLASGE